MGHSTSTRTRTRMKPVPVLTGVGTRRYGYGYRRVTRVWKPMWVGTAGLRQCPPLTVNVAPRFHPVSSCSRLWLGVLLWWWWRLCGHRRFRVVLCRSIRSICTHDPPYEEWLVGMGAGAVPFIIVVGGR
jgi:hypothetical protein